VQNDGLVRKGVEPDSSHVSSGRNPMDTTSALQGLC
jgi:hypothetical protein